MNEEELSSNIQLSDSSYLGLMSIDYDWDWTRTWPLNKKGKLCRFESEPSRFSVFPKHFKTFLGPHMFIYTYVPYMHTFLCRLNPVNMWKISKRKTSTNISVFCITKYCE